MNVVRQQKIYKAEQQLGTELKSQARQLLT